MPDLTSFTAFQALAPQWGHLQKPPTSAEHTFWEDVPPVQTFPPVQGQVPPRAVPCGPCPTAAL